MGVVPQAPTVYEVLEEIVITVQAQLVDVGLPFCAFNGGSDVFIDVGNKSLGLEALMHHLGFQPHQVSAPRHPTPLISEWVSRYSYTTPALCTGPSALPGKFEPQSCQQLS